MANVVEVEVDVEVEKVKWKPGDNRYEGKFHYRQVSPPGSDYVKSNGDIRADKTADELAVSFNWLSTTVEIDGKQYACRPRTPADKGVWVVAGSDKPKETDRPPVGGDEITVSTGGGKLKLKDKNAPARKYTYTLVYDVDIDGGQTLVDDPAIINRGFTP